MIRFIRSLPPGRAWAYLGVVMGFTLSIVANAAETVLTQTPIPLALRLPFAIAWPAFTYVAIEVLTRTLWQKFAMRNGQSWAHLIVRFVLVVPVGGIAAYSSYLHQSALFARGGEPLPIVHLGPIAVDGMLFACTATLIITKIVKQAAATKLNMVLQYAKPIGPMPFALATTEASVPLAISESVAPVSAPPATRTRKPRAQWDAAFVVQLAIDNVKNAEASQKAGIGESTFGRYKKVAQVLKASPTAEIDSAREKVPAEHVEMMRRIVNR
jgi:hypothetical protein